MGKENRVILEAVSLDKNDARAEYERRQNEKSAFVRQGQQLYAKVKESSKDYGQNAIAQNDPERWGWPFAVRIVGSNHRGCLVQGGPGGQYPLGDVDLFVVEDGCEIQIS